MSRLVIIIFLIAVGCRAGDSAPSTARSPNNSPTAPLGLILNEDNSHFFFTRTLDDMTVEGLHAFVDQYAGTKVSHLFLCPNAMKASFKSSTRDAIWELAGDQRASEGGATWIANAKALHERGLDPYSIWIDRCREKGISPWLTMRMNDVHHVNDANNYQHSTFWRKHPELRRVPGGASRWVDYAFDFGRPEVREHAMSFVRELLERYDADGIELDWMRFAYHFKPGSEAEGGKILTSFMRDVRDLTRAWSKRRGHPILVSVRVPTHPDAAAGLGMDGVTWGRERLVDMVVPTPFFSSSDFDIPVELWQERLGEPGRDVLLAPALEYHVRPSPQVELVPNDLLSFRGFVAASLHRGADQIYLFNFMDSQTRPVSLADYRTLLAEGATLSDVVRLPRRHIVAFRDVVPDGFPNDIVLPAEAFPGVRFRLYTGPAPTSGRVELIVALAEREGVTQATLAARVNDTKCTALGDFSDPGQFNGVRAMRFECPLGRVRAGYNEFEVKQSGDDPSQQLVWAEVRLVP